MSCVPQVSVSAKEQPEINICTGNRMKSKRSLRRNKVIKPRFQLQMAAAAVIFLLLYSLVLGAAIFYPLASDFSSTQDVGYKAQLAFTALRIHESLWPALIAISALAFVGTVLFSHRIAGPMYRFEKTVESLCKGDFSVRIKLRKRDEFHDFAGNINQLADYLENGRTREQNFRKQYRQLLDEMAERVKKQDPEKIGELLPTIEDLMAQFESSDKPVDSEIVN